MTIPEHPPSHPIPHTKYPMPPQPPSPLDIESQVMVKELSWLLEKQVPRTLQEIKACIKDGLLICSSTDPTNSVSAPTTPNKMYSSTLAVSSSNSDAVKGFVTISGPAIVKAELTLKLNTYNRGNPFRLALSPSKSIVLDQIQQAKNCLSLAFGALDAFDDEHNINEPGKTNDFDTLLQLIAKLNDVLKRGNHALTHFDTRHHFPQSPHLPSSRLHYVSLPFNHTSSSSVAVSSPLATSASSSATTAIGAFLNAGAGSGSNTVGSNPANNELSDDIILDYSIQRNALVVDVYVLSSISTGDGNGASSSSSGSAGGNNTQLQSLGNKLLRGFKTQSKTVKYKNRTVEVLEEWSVESPSPKLVSLLQSFRRAEELCMDLQRKLELFVTGVV